MSILYLVIAILAVNILGMRFLLARKCQRNTSYYKRTKFCIVYNFICTTISILLLTIGTEAGNWKGIGDLGFKEWIFMLIIYIPFPIIMSFCIIYFLNRFEKNTQDIFQN